MTFLVSRTSTYDEKPCEEAFKIMVPRWHIRTLNEEEYNKKFGAREGLWRSKVTEHGLTKEGYVKRREKDDEKWAVEINTLEELNTFSSKYGPIIIGINKDTGMGEIEIYDDYRE